MKKFTTILLIVSMAVSLHAQEKMDPSKNQFRQMRTDFTTPNAYRTASGAPGQLYWQQQANYQIAVELDDVDALYTNITDKKSIIKEPYITFYGMKEFMVRDINGYLFTFAQKAVQ